MGVISERLAVVYEQLGITVSSANPSPKCAFVGEGFCSRKGECYAHSVLDNQATAGGITDERLREATQIMTRDAQAAGCNVLVKS